MRITLLRQHGRRSPCLREGRGYFRATGERRRSRCSSERTKRERYLEEPVHKVRDSDATVGNHLRVGSFSKSQGEPSPVGSS
jgi:hypothetical protein